MKILSIKVAEFLEGSTREGKKLTEVALKKKIHQKDGHIHHLIQHLTYYN